MRKKKKIVNDFERSSIDYFNDINNFSSLTKEEELSLWEKYKKKNDLNARDKLVKSNLKFVASVATQYIGMGLPYQELVGVGNLGLMKAMEKFDYTRNLKTISYSVWWIRQAIIEALKKHNLINGDDSDFNVKIDEEDNFDFCSEQQEDEKYFEDFNDDNIKNVDESFLIKNLMETLTERERNVISWYFGLDGNEEMTLEDIGKRLNLTKERIRQIKECAFKKLRTEALKNSITHEIIEK